ncbi:unnamed protein product [Polarella glacialis]|uniref:Uncharacterized protein n=1 Tax=Polarella glacialis TaxID=89957 RepID=A0A813FZV1_POLGL|nr:unnamed protein product [Polarella glacialis]
MASCQYTQYMELLDKWPPPKKYRHKDWLVWTQSDQDLNTDISDYCSLMRNRLKDSLSAELAEDFRQSKDATDRLLWQLRAEETRTFKECIALARTVSASKS